VPEILTFDDLTEVHDYLLNVGMADSRFAFKTLSRLHGVVKSGGIISYYDEEAQDLDKVLNIFIRVNSGGTPLSFIDFYEERRRRMRDRLTRLLTGELAASEEQPATAAQQS
jgi:hypothetical protein